MIPPPSASEPSGGGHEARRAQQARVDHRLGDRALDEREARPAAAPRRPAGRATTTAKPERASVSPLTSSVIAATSSSEADPVEPARVLGRRLGQQAAGREHQREREHRDHGVRLAPAGADRSQRRRQHRSPGDPDADAAPQTAVERARSTGSAAAVARAASPQASTAAPPRPSSTRPPTNSEVSCASAHASAPRPISDRTDEVGPAPADGVADRAAREQAGGEAEAHRAEHPRRAARAGAEVARRSAACWPPGSRR